MNIDYNLLATQKFSLLYAIEALGKHAESKYLIDDLHGIVHLLDAIQDDHETKEKEADEILAKYIENRNKENN